MTGDAKHLDYTAITSAQQQVWATGDFSVVALSIMPVSEALIAAADPQATERVLDIACGSGNTALVAARRYCEVTALDYVPALLKRAEQRAQAEGTPIEFVQGDAQALPFEASAFDVVLSTFGVMFAPDQRRAAAELSRVCRPGATIGLASWTPEGAVGDFFRTVSKYAPAPAGLESPMTWGTEQGVRELLGGQVSSLDCKRCLVTEYFRSVAHALEVFRVYFGPTRRAFEALDEAGKQALATDLSTLFSASNCAKNGTFAMPLEYLQVVARRR